MGKKMNVLITGGAGFIGSHLADEFLKRGEKVIILDDLSGGFEENVPRGAIFIKGSTTDANLVSYLFTKYKFDYVYHTAAYAAEGLSHFIRSFNYYNNILGTVTIINESIKHKVKCLAYFSSMAVYGTNQLPFKEYITPAPEDPYGIAKYSMEMDIRAAHDLFGLNYIIFRPHNVYGERQNIGDRYRNVIGIFMNQIMSGKKLTIFGDGEQRRAFSYIGDVAPFIASAVYREDVYGETFNVGADKDCSINELAEIVSAEFGVKLDTETLPTRYEVKNAFSDQTKIKKVFGYKAKTKLEEGVHKMAEWAKGVGAKKTEQLGKIEIYEKIPQVWLR